MSNTMDSEYARLGPALLIDMTERRSFILEKDNENISLSSSLRLATLTAIYTVDRPTDDNRRLMVMTETSTPGMSQ